MMKTTMLLLTVALVGGIALAGPASAHIQVFEDHSITCFSYPFAGHLHYPGDATDDCTPDDDLDFLKLFDITAN